MVNKFNTSWQLVRVNARDIKDPEAKLAYVLDFLNEHRDIYNYERVLNWVKMTAIAYKDETRELYESAAAELTDQRSFYNLTTDTPTDFKLFERTDLERLYKDLERRKYGFQIPTAPKSHADYVEQLRQYLYE